jgi:hypothetical protein
VTDMRRYPFGDEMSVALRVPARVAGNESAGSHPTVVEVMKRWMASLAWSWNVWSARSGKIVGHGTLHVAGRAGVEDAG